MWSLFGFIPALVIIYEDFKHRAISWWLLPILFFCLFLEAWSRNPSMNSLGFNIGVNIIILLIQFAVVFIYFSIKNRKWVNIFKSYVGIGDLLFLFAISPFFTPIHFVLFEIVSLVLILVGSLTYGLIKKDWSFKIPLAGLQAILLILNISYTYIFVD